MSSYKDIPGFYFDSEKGKYFRIQPNHKVPAGAAHSQGAVNAKKINDAVAEREQARRDRDAQGIQRVESGSYTNVSLSARCGARPSRNIKNLQKHYAASLQCQRVGLGSKSHAVAISSEGRLYTVQYDRHHVRLVQTNDFDGHATLSMDIHQRLPIRHTDISHLEVFDDHYSMFMDDTLRIGRLRQSHDLNPVIEFRLGRVRDMSAFHPSGSLALVGQKEDAFKLWFVRDISQPSPTALNSLHREQMFVAFKDTNIIMSGQRNGIVNFTDHRVPSTVARIKHSSAVNGISGARSVNDVLVTGLQSAAVYDLRAIRAVKDCVPPRGGSSWKRRGILTAFSSQPVVPFYMPIERQSQLYAAGKFLAYIASHDIAVISSYQQRASTSDRVSYVTLYDASTGRVLPSKLSRTAFDTVDHIRVGRLRDGPESLLVNTQHSLQEWTVDRPLDEAEFSDLPESYSYQRTKVSRSTLKSGMDKAWELGDKGPG